MRTRRTDIKPGSRWRQVRLGSEAVYRVLACSAEHVDVEVERAPGLETGMRLRLTRAAVEAMEPMDAGGLGGPGGPDAGQSP